VGAVAPTDVAAQDDGIMEPYESGSPARVRPTVGGVGDGGPATTPRRRRAAGEGARHHREPHRLRVPGRLATDRTHQLGAQFLYNLDMGLTLGVNQYIGSGTPISTIGKIPNNNFFYPYGRGDLGDTPWLTQTDLSLNYNLPLSGRVSMSLGLSVLNLFDEDTPTRQWTRAQTQDLPVTDQDFLTGFDYAALAAEVDQDAAYGLYDTFQGPRELRFTVKIEF